MRLRVRNSAMAIELNDFIHYHENVLSPDICKFLIDLFEKNSDKHEKIENERKPNFTQFNLTENCKIGEEVDNIHNYLIRVVLEYKKKYYEFVDSRCFPEKNNFEQFRIKRYDIGKDEAFDTHVDVCDYPSARRYLSFLWYLNDVSSGGETVFYDLKIKPKSGSMIIFPPLWMFPHYGAEPLSNKKYIMSTYLHYK